MFLYNIRPIIIRIIYPQVIIFLIDDSPILIPPLDLSTAFLKRNILATQPHYI